jgi:hypothetical protein
MPWAFSRRSGQASYRDDCCEEGLWETGACRSLLGSITASTADGEPMRQISESGNAAVAIRECLGAAVARSNGDCPRTVRLDE